MGVYPRPRSPVQVGWDGDEDDDEAGETGVLLLQPVPRSHYHHQYSGSYGAVENFSGLALRLPPSLDEYVKFLIRLHFRPDSLHYALPGGRAAARLPPAHQPARVSLWSTLRTMVIDWHRAAARALSPQMIGNACGRFLAAMANLPNSFSTLPLYSSTRFTLPPPAGHPGLYSTAVLPTATPALYSLSFNSRELFSARYSAEVYTLLDIHMRQFWVLELLGVDGSPVVQLDAEEPPALPVQPQRALGAAAAQDHDVVHTVVMPAPTVTHTFTFQLQFARPSQLLQFSGVTPAELSYLLESLSDVVLSNDSFNITAFSFSAD